MGESCLSQLHASGSQDPQDEVQYCPPFWGVNFLGLFSVFFTELIVLSQVSSDKLSILAVNNQPSDVTFSTGTKWCYRCSKNVTFNPFFNPSFIDSVKLMRVFLE